MLHIDETSNTIQLTRGDTARFSVPIDNETSGEEYVLSDDDRITFTVKKRVKDETPLFQKTVFGTTLFHVKPEDTQGLSFGKYVYDIQLTTSDGDVYTVIEPSTFEILSEVTY